MPEIANRDAVDVAATNRIHSLFQQHMRRVIGFGGPARVPDGEWQRQERELAALLLLLLDDVFQAGSSFAPTRAPGLLRAAGKDYAGRVAGGMAADGTANTRIYLDDGGSIEVAYGRERAKSLAVTEITRARVAGERAVLDELESRGATITAIWRTEQDAKVCPICRPLDGEDQFRWELDFPDGPPAHPRCRCTLEYEVEMESAI